MESQYIRKLLENNEMRTTTSNGKNPLLAIVNFSRKTGLRHAMRHYSPIGASPAIHPIKRTANRSILGYHRIGLPMKNPSRILVCALAIGLVTAITLNAIDFDPSARSKMARENVDTVELRDAQTHHFETPSGTTISTHVDPATGAEHIELRRGGHTHKLVMN